MANDWQKAIASFRRKVDTLPVEVAKETGRLAAAELIARTPQLTGHLIFNWRVRFSPSAVERKGTDLGGQVVLAEMLAAIEKIDRARVFYLVNPTSYGPHVEYGTERMEARLFVAAAQAKLKRLARQAIKNVQARQR